jgi:phage gp29-like protein
VTKLVTLPRALRRPADSRLLDSNGRPLPPVRPRLRVAAPNARGTETYNRHPAFGLTAEMLFSYFRLAEAGQPLQQFDMFDDLIERWGSLRGMINYRNESVSGCDFVIMPPPGRVDALSVKAAAELNERLQSQLQFREFLGHQLSAVPYGVAMTNMVWDYDQGIVVPVEFVNPAARRFASPSQERADEIWLYDGTPGSMGLIALDPGLWAISRYRYRNPWAAGLMRTCSILAMFTGWGVLGWQTYLDMFGLPLAIGYYDEGAGPESRKALEDAVVGIGQDGYAVLSSLTELVIKETARGGDSSTAYPQILRWCEDQAAKLLTGGTLNTDVSGSGAGSYNAAAVHESRGYAMLCNDAKTVEEMFVRDIGRPFVAWNGYDGAAPPRLKIRIRRDALQWAQTIEILGQAVELDPTQIYEDFGLRVPAKGTGVKFEATKPPDPGHAREDKNK